MSISNILTNRWIPLETASLTAGSPDDSNSPVTYASYVELLSGERDALDLYHPRDDIKFFTRTLLSALTQALFGAADADELRDRIARPLVRAELEESLMPVLGDFEAIGGPAFLQSGVVPSLPPPSSKRKATTSLEPQTIRLLFGIPTGNNHNLFRSPHEYNTLCFECFVPALYGAQSLAPSGGAGFSPSVTGSPPVVMLVSHPNGVRATTWSNVLATPNVDAIHHVVEGNTPWNTTTNKDEDSKPIGFIEGLFWQPRTLASRHVGPGACPLCGRTAEVRVEVLSFTPYRKAGDRKYRHPYTSLLEYTDRTGTPTHTKNYQFRSDRPVFTGLPELLGDLSEALTEKGVLGRRAPVVAQALETIPEAATSLIVFQYLFDKASLKGIYTSSFPLSRELLSREVLAQVREAVACTGIALKMVTGALKSAGGDAIRMYQSDAESAFWANAEGSFWDYVRACSKNESGRDEYFAFIRSLATGLFDQHTEMLLGEARRLPSLVTARARLLAGLRKELALSTEPKVEEEKKRSTRRRVKAGIP